MVLLWMMWVALAIGFFCVLFRGMIFVLLIYSFVFFVFQKKIMIIICLIITLIIIAIILAIQFS